MKKFVPLFLVSVLLLTALLSLTSCGTKSSKGLKFRSNGDGTCTWIGLGTCTDTEIVVPEKNGDETVVSVGKEVLERKEGITKVSLPNTVKVLEEMAFAYNEDLCEIDLGKGIEIIEENALAYCEKLQKASFPNGLRKIGRGAFAFDKALIEIELPESIEIVEDGAFNETVNVKRISIPDGLNEFSTTVFCTNSLEELALKGEMQRFKLAVATDSAGNMTISGGVCKDPSKTQLPNTYDGICTKDNLASVICAILGKETLILNGEAVTPSAKIEPGTYLKENNMYAFEITDLQELVVSFGIVQSRDEVARLKYEANNETQTLSAKGSATLVNGTLLDLDITLVPFGNSFFTVMVVTDNTDSELVTGLWCKS